MTEQNFIAVTVVPHPFAVERIQEEYHYGLRLSEIVTKHIAPMWHEHCFVTINGENISRAQWAKVKPKAGSLVTVRMVPMGGGGGKNPLRTVLSLAIAAAAPGLTGAMIGGLGLGGGGFFNFAMSQLMTRAVGLAGQLLLNAVAPPGRPKNNRAISAKESPTLFIRGARNDMRPFGRIPRVLGRHRMVPPLGARPYTETVGNDQYLRMIFVWGYGPLEISDLKIGETSLMAFDGVEVETRQGYEDDAPLSLYSGTVLQNDLDIVIKNTSGYITRTSEAEADEITLDFTFPRGLFNYDQQSNKRTSSVQLEIQYAPVGSNDWSAPALSYKAVNAQSVQGFIRPVRVRVGNQIYHTQRMDSVVLDPQSGRARRIEGQIFRLNLDQGQVMSPLVPEGMIKIADVLRQSSDLSDVVLPSHITDHRSNLVGREIELAPDFLVTAGSGVGTVNIASGGLQYKGLIVSARQSSALRRAVSFKVARGQYDIRVKRLTSDATLDTVFDEVVWSALKTVRHEEPIHLKGLAVTALRIKATDQLSGVIDRFNGIAHSIVDDFDGTAWVKRTSANPAALYRHVLTASENAKPRLLSELDEGALAAWYERCAEKNREFNAVIDYDTTLQDVLNDIASAGRAAPSLKDGKWSVVEDLYQTTPIQLFTPRNSFGFEAEKLFEELPHALRVRFIDRARDFEENEVIIYSDGYHNGNARYFETLELPGVTSLTQAYEDGRYHLTTLKYRRQRYYFYTDLDHLVCTRGDLIRLVHDAALEGVLSARVKSISSLQNGDVISLRGDEYFVFESNKNYQMRYRTRAGEIRTVALENSTVRTDEFVFRQAIPSHIAPAVGDLFAVGEIGYDVKSMIVTAIEPMANFKARVTAVDAIKSMYDENEAELPLGLGGGFVSSNGLEAPVIAFIQSSEEVMIQNIDGSLTSRVLIQLAPAQNINIVGVHVFVKALDETSYTRASVLSYNNHQISLLGLERGEHYNIIVKYKDQSGQLSPPSQVANHLIVGTGRAPSDVARFHVVSNGQSNYLSWQAVNEIDISHYVIKFTSELVNPSWSAATILNEAIPKAVTQLTVPRAVGTYLIKAYDYGGRSSAQAMMAQSTVTAFDDVNIVATQDESLSFGGTFTNTAIYNDALILMPTDSIDSINDFDNASTVDFDITATVSEGAYFFENVFDLGSVYTSHISSIMQASAIDLAVLFDYWDGFDNVENIDQSVDPSLWNAQIYIKMTEADPSDVMAWSAWQPLMIGDYTARAFQFKIDLKSYQNGVTPYIEVLKVMVDMPDRTISKKALVTSTSGLNVLFDYPFFETPVFAVHGYGLNTGDYYRITGASAEGFTITFYDANNIAVIRTCDIIAKGYGIRY